MPEPVVSRGDSWRFGSCVNRSAGREYGRVNADVGPSNFPRREKHHKRSCPHFGCREIHLSGDSFRRMLMNGHESLYLGTGLQTGHRLALRPVDFCCRLD